MLTRTKWLPLFLSSLVGIMSLSCFTAFAADITLYTPYTEISVPPGQVINYEIDAINNSNVVQNIRVSVSGMPKGWEYTMKSGGWAIKKIAILPGKKKLLVLRLNVPLKVDKGRYRFRVNAGGITSLPLEVVVSKQGTFKTELTTSQANMQGNSTSTFTFKASLRNVTADKQLYALQSEAPEGWNVIFKVNYKQVTSVDVDPNSDKSVTISINPPAEVKAGTYKIPISATTNSTSANLTLEVVVTGTFKMALTTPRGLLSTDITAGKTKREELIVRNNGSAELKNIRLTASHPTNWDVKFDPKKIPQLEPGNSTHVFASIKADKKAIPGDYVTDLEARTPEVASKATFRLTVKTPMVWGWIGVLIILIALGSVYYLFRKYGRR